MRSYEIFGRPRRPSRRADDLAVMRWGRQVTFDCQFAITTRLMRSDLNARAGNLQTSGVRTPHMTEALCHTFQGAWIEASLCDVSRSD